MKSKFLFPILMVPFVSFGNWTCDSFCGYVTPEGSVQLYSQKITVMGEDENLRKAFQSAVNKCENHLNLNTEKRDIPQGSKPALVLTTFYSNGTVNTQLALKKQICFKE